MKICVNLGFAVSFLAGLFHSNPCWFATWWRWRSCWVSGMGDLDYGMPLLVLEWSTWFNVSCRILQIDKESFIQICLMPANTRHRMQRSYCIRSSDPAEYFVGRNPDKVRVTILEKPETLHPLAKTTIVIAIIKDSWLAPIPKADLEVYFDVNEGKLKHYLPRFRTTFPLLRLKPQLVLELQFTPELWRVKDPKGPESTQTKGAFDFFHTFWRPNMWPIEPRYVKFGEGSDWLRSDDCQVLQSCCFPLVALGAWRNLAFLCKGLTS